MANGMYSTPLMGTGIVANPMQLQRNAMLMGTTMQTMPQVSTPMPPMSTVMPPPMPTVTQTPQVSTPMPPMSTVTQTPQVSTTSSKPSGERSSFPLVTLVTEETLNLAEILTYPVYYSADGVSLYKDAKTNLIYAVDDELKSLASEILKTRDTGLENITPVLNSAFNQKRQLTVDTQTNNAPPLTTDIFNLTNQLVSDVTEVSQTIAETVFAKAPVIESIVPKLPVNTFYSAFNKGLQYTSNFGNSSGKQSNIPVNRFYP